MRRLSRWIILAAALLPVGGALGDTVWVRSGGGSAIPFSDVRIDRIERQRLYFSVAGRETSRPLDEVHRLMVDDEPAFNAAEEAFADERWAEATEQYQRAIRGAGRAWLADWARVRLLEAADRSGRFDAAAAAWLDLLRREPELGMGYRPTVPAGPSVHLDAAAERVNEMLKEADLPAGQQQALLGFLLEIHRSRGDRPAADEVAGRLLRFNADFTGDPAAARALAQLRLDAAKEAIGQGRYQQALDEIEAQREVFIDPSQQAEALLRVAQARHGLADRADPVALKEAALDYMRVVAHFGDIRRHAAEALLGAAEIHLDLDDPAAAMRLLREVAEAYSDQPAAEQARMKIEQLQG